MCDLTNFFDISPYSIREIRKQEMLTAALTDLTRHHYANCLPYRRMLDALAFRAADVKSYTDIPFLPVRLFKEFDLMSVTRDNVIKTMTSSGTSGQDLSRIFLDKGTAANQQRALVKIMSELVGCKRLPVMILDTSAAIRDRAIFSARGVGILGFSMLGSDRIFALDENMRIDTDVITAFLNKHKGETILLFGFTFIIWQHFYKELTRTGFRPNLSKAVLIHGGGWKKLLTQAVSEYNFKECLREACGVARIHNYYGMVEQTGSICIECEEGHLHTPVYSDIVARRYTDFSPCNIGEKGILQAVSVLPKSYPGHILLTEDEGAVLGEDNCPCGRLGKYFKIYGRIANAEIRGCSDTYANQFE
jgi:hypothetical protein